MLIHGLTQRSHSTNSDRRLGVDFYQSLYNQPKVGVSRVQANSGPSDPEGTTNYQNRINLISG